MRARNIRPGFFENEDIQESSMAARLAFIGMWCVADREGRLEDRPRKIKLLLMPYDDIDMNECINELQRRGFLSRYEVDGERYIQIENFLKHQKPHPNETPSVIPPPNMANRKELISIAEALIDERITEDDAGMSIDDAKSILGVKEEPKSTNGAPRSTNGDPCSACSLTLLLSHSIEEKTKTSCSEPCEASDPKADDPVIISIPTNRFETKKECYDVRQSFVSELKTLYPAVDVQQSLNAIRAWNLTNPGKRKTLKGVPKHINAWLAKEQNRGNGRHPPAQYKTQRQEYQEAMERIRAELEEDEANG